jgi:hypothetical protein
MRTVGVFAIIVGVCVFGACSSSTSTPTATSGATSPTASASAASPSSTLAATTSDSTAASTPPAPDGSAAAGSFPARCTDLVSNADIDALALQHLQLGTDSVIAVGGLTSQLVCRFQGTGTGADTAIIVVASGYSDAATASSEDGLARTTAQEQGGVFIKLDGVAEEAYSFTYPTLTGVAARNGNRSVSIGVGKLLGVPNPGDYTRLLQALFAKLAS